jgi:hypothetical protein
VIKVEITPRYIGKKFIFIDTKNKHTSKGKIICDCGCTDFAVCYHGNIRKSILGVVQLRPNDDTDNAILVEAICINCGRHFHVFDNRMDGYCNVVDGAYMNKILDSLMLNDFKCRYCTNMAFTIEIKWEYPPIDEMDELGDSYFDAFTWIWIELQCSRCGNKFHQFIDYETC